ncbi:unnamed protein product [Closterium sp. Naga37s-1]|nr:unnamed protein product [Closterium sp. Naga37s-1]
MAASAVSSLSASASDTSTASAAAISSAQKTLVGAAVSSPQGTIEEPPHGRTASPCAACKFLRRKCTAECVFAPYFPPDQPGRFANVHRVFGASNVTRILTELPPELRGDAANSMAYEAEARVQDPVYGCVSAISLLQQHVVHLQTELLVAQHELSGLQRALEASAQAAQGSPTYPPAHATTTTPLSFASVPTALSAPTAPTAVPFAPCATAPPAAVPAAAAAPSVACASQAAAAAAAAPDASVPPALLLESVTGAGGFGAGVELMQASFESQTPPPAGTAVVASLQAAPVAALQPAPVPVL